MLPQLIFFFFNKYIVGDDIFELLTSPLEKEKCHLSYKELGISREYFIFFLKKKVNSLLYIYIYIYIYPLNSSSAGLTKKFYYATWQGYLAFLTYLKIKLI